MGFILPPIILPALHHRRSRRGPNQVLGRLLHWRLCSQGNRFKLSPPIFLVVYAAFINNSYSDNFSDLQGADLRERGLNRIGRWSRAISQQRYIFVILIIILLPLPTSLSHLLSFCMTHWTVVYTCPIVSLADREPYYSE